LGKSSTSASLRGSALAISDCTAQAPAQAARKARLEDEVVGLFDQFRDRLLRYLMALGLPAHDGEEVVQEVFLALFRHLQLSKSRENLKGWIFRVAHNLGLKQRIRTRRQCQRMTEIGYSRAGSRADTRPDPEEQVLQDERQQRLRAVVDALPEQDQWCLYLRAEGLRYREIAEALDISLGAVSLSLGRSLARLARVDGR
jgi:RNA polymerase sigma-70 factor (ECF subfamily)